MRIDLAENDMTDLPVTSEDCEMRVTGIPNQCRQSTGHSGGDIVAEEQTDLSILDDISDRLDDINEHPFSGVSTLTSQETSVYLTRILAEYQIFSKAMTEAIILDDDEAINRIEARLDGKTFDDTPLRVEVTLDDLGVVKKKRPNPDPETKPKPVKKLTLIEQVQEDCDSFKSECDFMKCDVHEEYKKPVVPCKVSIPEIAVPNLVLRAFKGYPKSGTVTYAFQRPPIGWCGPLEEIKKIFKNSVSSVGEHCGVDTVLRAWKSAISGVSQRKQE